VAHEAGLAPDRLVVSEGLEGLSGSDGSHLGRSLLIEGLTVTCHFALMLFAQMSLRANVTKSGK
jgi:hypothetical protein